MVVIKQSARSLAHSIRFASYNMADQTNHPLVSIIIPAYNQDRFLSTTIKSALKQTYPYLEVILVDDESTDTTPQIGQRFEKEDSRFHYLKQPNQGPAAARNTGIAHSKGEFIFLLDGDDLMEPELIQQALSIFTQNPNVDIVYTAFHIIDEDSRLVGEIHSETYSPQDLLALLFFRNVIGPGAVMAKRACLLDCPYNEAMRHAEDYELLLRLAHRYRFYYIDKPLRSYRRHGQNLSNDLTAHHEATLQVLNQYSSAHIQEVVERSSFSQEEKELLLGKILYSSGRLSEAILCFHKLNQALAYFYLGNCYFKQQKWTQAKEAYQTSLKLDNSNPACHNNLGIVVSLLKENDLARKSFERALELKPGYLDAQLNLENINICQTVTKFTERELRSNLIPYKG